MRYSYSDHNYYHFFFFDTVLFFSRYTLHSYTFYETSEMYQIQESGTDNHYK